MQKRECLSCGEVYPTDIPKNATCPECGSFASRPVVDL